MKVIITQKQANDILDILNGVIEEEECFISEAGEKNCCFHCQIEKAAEYLFDGGLELRKYRGENLELRKYRGENHGPK